MPASWDAEIKRLEKSEARNITRRKVVQMIIGRGGSGKTTVANAIIAVCWLLRIPVAAVAFTGAASVSLKLGITAHKCFNINVGGETREMDISQKMFLSRLQLVVFDEMSQIRNADVEEADENVALEMEQDQGAKKSSTKRTEKMGERMQKLERDWGNLKAFFGGVEFIGLLDWMQILGKVIIT